jgi:hypothetical protein
MLPEPSTATAMGVAKAGSGGESTQLWMASVSTPAGSSRYTALPISPT